VRAAVAMVPVPGLDGLLEMIISPPLARRRSEWERDVVAAIRQLESERGIKPEQLQDNPAFIDAVLTAFPLAVKTSQHAKRAALRNAVINAALPGAPEVAVQQMFFALVDRFTEWHLRILKIFRDPATWRNAEGVPLRPAGSLSTLIEQAYPELRGRPELRDQIWSELGAAGLHRSGGLNTTMTPDGTMSARTTEHGNQFLDFIENPFRNDG
jgi:hypothetical protein